MSIGFEFVHEDIDACNAATKIVIDAAATPMIAYDASTFNKKSTALPTLVPQLTEYSRFPIKVSDAGIGNVFQGNLSPKKFPSIPIEVTFDSAQRLILSMTPSVGTRDELAKILCRQSQELEGLEPFCSLESFELDSSQSQITGVARFEVAEPFRCPWTIDSYGKCSLDLDAEAKRKAKFVKKDQPPKRSGSAKSAALEEATLKEAATKSINSLGPIASMIELGSVTSNSLGSFITIGVNIGDWLPVRIGPIRVQSPTDVDQALKQALKSESFVAAANTQLAQIRNHPRFGRCRARLTEWQPHEGTARIVTTILLTDRSLPLDVEERIRAIPEGAAIETQVSGHWIASSGDSLAKRLRPQAKDFCLTVSKSIESVSGFPISIDIDEDDSRPWLSISPPELSVKAKMTVPIMQGLEFGLGKLRIGQGGISLPRTVMVQPMMSVPCGYFTASDPRCEVDFAARRLLVGFKATPLFPFPQIPLADRNMLTLASYGLDGIPLSKVRWDNLYLHAGHVFIQADGTLKSQGMAREKLVSLGTQGTIVLLDDTRLASCRGELDLENWRLARLGMQIEADLNPSGTNIARLSGHLEFAPQETEKMKIRGLAELRGLQVNGSLAYRSEGKQASIRVEGKSKIPIVGLAKLDGESNLSFKKYSLSGEGVVPVPMVGRQVHYRVDADQYRTKFNWWWETADGRIVHYTTESPRVDLIDEQTLLSELNAVVQASNDSKNFKSEKLGGVAVSEPPKSTVKPFVDLRPPRATAASIDEEFREPREVDFKLQGSRLAVLYKDTGQEFAAIDSTSFGESDWSGLDIWTGWTPDEKFGLFAVREGVNDGKIYTALLHDGKAEVPAIPLTDKELRFAVESRALHPRKAATNVLRNRAVLLDAIEMRLHGHTQVDWKVESKYTSVSGVSRTGKIVHKSYAIDTTGGVQRFTYLGLSGSDLNYAMAAFSQGMRGLEADLGRDWNIVAYRRINGKDCCAAMARVTKDRCLMNVLQPDGTTTLTIERAEAIPQSLVVAHAAQIGGAVMSQAITGPTVAYVGPAGSCTCTKSGWCLMPVSSSSSESVSTQPVLLDKIIFDQHWAAPSNASDRSTPSSEVLLPKALQSPAQRKQASLQDIARLAVCDWEGFKRERNQDQRWLAHPMGLLVELCKRNNAEVKRE